MRVISYIKRLPFAVLIGVIILFSMIPVIEVVSVLGVGWQGFTPVFGDEGFYYAHVQTIAEGYYNDGNPYFFEHRSDPPPVIFGGAWLNVLPLLLGMPFNAAMLLNFVLWGLAFVSVAYLLYREFSVPSWISVVGAVALYMQCYPHIFRPANLQPVYPFYFLFYLALARLMRERSKTNIVLLSVVSASTFYLFSYLWQAVVVTLGLLVLYALVRRDWQFFKSVLLSSVLSGILGLPAVLYTFWLSHTSPYFWESIARFGLVYTRIPMAEVVYSGGWIGAMLAFLALLYWRSPALRTAEFRRLCLFAAVGGLGLWITQGSNALTGILVETGEHVRMLILPWVLFVTVILGAYLFRRRADLALPVRTLSVLGIGILTLASAYYTQYYFMSFVAMPQSRGDAWVEEQSFVKPFEWLQAHERSAVVVWSDPRDEITSTLPIFTRHFTLYTPIGMWHLVSTQELSERYLVSQYFNNPTTADLQSDIGAYLGRQDVFHIAKTIERKVKLCRILFFWDKDRDCGATPTSLELLGNPFFDSLQQKFTDDVRPHIKSYLRKYNVSYILKDVIRNPNWHPEDLRAKLVYSDGRYELYRLPL
ncbi:MAG: hypothetical protein AAB919_02840 [Patescibacteria group bacterium]